ncbi:N-acetyl sugar amidotransferase [Oceanospirillaceae bacterium]|nr:N-acetyl sugar amidotransferase [Oceanospirillaceae bacterium]
MSQSLFGLPEKIEYCEICVISNQRPSSSVEMTSDGTQKIGIGIIDGVCSACRYNHKKQNIINWDERSEAFYKLLEPYRSRDGSYDVLVPSSGGKDSSYTAHLLKYKYDMNPLAVTWAPNMFTDIGFENFNNLTRIGGIDSNLYTPNGRLHSYLTRSAFLNLCHPFQPFIHGQKVIGPKMAHKLGIKLVVYGENQAEYGNPMDQNLSPIMDPDFFVSDDPLSMKFGGVSIAEIIETTNFSLKDFQAYIPINSSQLKQSGIKMTYLGYFEKWDPQSVYYYVCENTGFNPAPERSEGTYSRYTEIDDKIVPFHFYTTFIKFGIGRATYDACQEIRNGHLDRDEAIALVRKFDGEFPQKWYQEFLNYIEINEETFAKTIDKNRSRHIWTKSSDGYDLTVQI